MTLRLFTSESVTEGHPDKICDQISDSILDTLISQDAHSRTAVETLVTTGLVHVAGEIRTSGYADIAAIARRVINGIGYTSSEMGFDGDSCGVTVSIGEQSPEIGDGVSTSEEARDGNASHIHDQQGAGDQGIMFSYATNETPEMMPLAIKTAHRLAERLTTARKSGQLPLLRPDGKTQVTLGYDGATPRTVENQTIVSAVREVFDLRPGSIIRDLELLRPIYAQTAAYGHFGRELPEFTWERTDRADALRDAAQ